MAAVGGKEVLAEIVAGLKGVTEGPWQSVEHDTEDGSGGYVGYAVEAVSEKTWLDGKSIVDVYNSGVTAIEVEHDEDGGSHAWDEQGRKDTAHIARCSPDRILLLAAYAEELRGALKLAQKALAMMIDPSSIMQTTVVNAFAAATAAEARARDVLAEREGERA